MAKKKTVKKAKVKSKAKKSLGKNRTAVTKKTAGKKSGAVNKKSASKKKAVKIIASDKKVAASKSSVKTKVTKTLGVKGGPKKSATQAPNTAQVTQGLYLKSRVPGFDLMSTDGVFNIENLAGKNIVLYFYPKDDTPGCTLEAQNFSDNLNHFAAENTVVYGVSKDSLKSHQSFCQKYSYKHHLVSDDDEKLCQAFGTIKEKNMYGRTYMGIDRSTFLIDKNGILVEEWRGVKVAGHVDKVLDRVKALNKRGE